MLVSLDDIISMEYSIKLKLRNGSTIQLVGDPQEGLNIVQAAFSMQMPNGTAQAPNDSETLPNDEDRTNDYINHNILMDEDEPIDAWYIFVMNMKINKS